MGSPEVPTYFRACILEARHSQAGYLAVGWHLAIHLEDHAESEDLDALAAAIESDDPQSEVWAWLRLALPGCARLVPTRRRNNFMEGVMIAVEQGRVV